MPFIVLAVILLILIVVDQLTVTRPEMPSERKGDPVPTRPQAGDAPFLRQPLAPTYEERRAAYMTWLLQQKTADDRGGIWTDAGKLAAGATQINPLALQDGLDFVNAHKDPSDFTVAGLVRLYYLQAGKGILTPEQETAIQGALTNFKYWFDQEGHTEVEMWTENHQILNHSSEYLAGQAFPEVVFGSGQNGEWHRQQARQRILRWIDWHARTGFAEWDSVVYYTEDIAPLLNLVEFAQDEEIATRAAMMVDALLFDTAVDSYYGVFATSHGRATAGSIKSGAGDGIVTLQAIAWGLGRFQSSSSMAVISLVTSPRYHIPAVIEAAAQDMPQEYENFERHSIPLTQGAADTYGLSFTDPQDLWVWWGMGAFTNPPVIATTIGAADTWNLWHYPDFADLKDLAQVLQRFKLLGLASSLLDPQSNGVLLSEVNKVTYRTPDYILSTAQDYRKGEKGYQQHITQAALDPYAVVFTTNPDSLRSDDSQRPSYWSSSGRLPRAGQVKNVAITIYNISRRPTPKPLESRHYAFSHAYFPRWAFDEVVEVPANGSGGWIIGRKGEGYVALYSQQPYQWTTTGPDADQEVIALGLQNVWITQAGRKAVDGSFEDFVKAISAARVSASGLSVAYDAPGLGQVKFGWDGPLTANGQEVPLRGYARWQNPYTTVDFNSQRYEITFAGHSLLLDFAAGTRQEK